MRKLIYAINLTIDGCCDHTKVNGSDDILEYFAALLQDAGVLLYGRITYQLMVPFWPDIAKNQSGQTKAVNEFARTFDTVGQIVVVSQSLDSVEKNARIVRGNLKEDILQLKQEPGKNIFTGGVDLPRQLIALGLVDEYYFVVHPILVGEGRRLDLQERLPLKLVESTTLPNGCVALHLIPGVSG
ncbi:dihydrofolate reductase family protein [Dinghuibacter silviterrae]|uniref:Dihydrofolate reductase n=1 Tax=Dinghuibacter silviterrae TaxID=1539049 RepID=A0A4R8DVC1_9BACT|nr:dihydrofolate reductase family protein [Dinghuibacter silviterrae]TDX02139.1 dihydrofolate reductase [Dinghuibacter silviterrae]